MSWIREFNLSYGRQVVANEDIALYAGVGLKYLRGIAVLDIRAENGELDAFSAISPVFGIDYGDSAVAANPSADTTKRGNFFPKSAGQGFGLDFGINVIIKEKFKIGFAVNDIGSMEWDVNVFEAKDNTLTDMRSSGFDSYNLFQEAEGIVGREREIF